MQPASGRDCWRDPARLPPLPKIHIYTLVCALCVCAAQWCTPRAPPPTPPRTRPPSASTATRTTVAPRRSRCPSAPRCRRRSLPTGVERANELGVHAVEVHAVVGTISRTVNPLETVPVSLKCTHRSDERLVGHHSGEFSTSSSRWSSETSRRACATRSAITARVESASSSPSSTIPSTATFVSISRSRARAASGSTPAPMSTGRRRSRRRGRLDAARAETGGRASSRRRVFTQGFDLHVEGRRGGSRGTRRVPPRCDEPFRVTTSPREHGRNPTLNGERERAAPPRRSRNRSRRRRRRRGDDLRQRVDDGGTEGATGSE